LQNGLIQQGVFVAGISVADMSVEDASLDELLHIVDVLVDGRYEVSERDLTLAFRGSRNQRPIDLVRTWETGKVSLAEKF